MSQMFESAKSARLTSSVCSEGPKAAVVAAALGDGDAVGDGVGAGLADGLGLGAGDGVGVGVGPELEGVVGMAGAGGTTMAATGPLWSLRHGFGAKAHGSDPTAYWRTK